jgi:hypothetical protein
VRAGLSATDLEGARALLARLRANVGAA